MGSPWIRPQPHERRPDPHGAVGLVDPTGTALKDADALIYVQDAHIGVLAAEQFDGVRQILGNPARVEQADRWQEENPLLPVIRCGDTARNGQRCGAAIRPALNAEGYYYSHAVCEVGRGGHTGRFPAELEHFVVAMIADALAQESLRGAVSSIELKLHGAAQRLAEVNRKLRRIEADLSEISNAELEARREGREDDKKHWVKHRTALRGEEALLLAECKALASRVAALSVSGTAARLAREAHQLAADVPKLLRESVAVRGLTASLVGALTRSISVSSVGSHLVLIEIVFLDGTVAQRLVVTGRFYCTQPQRIAAWAWRRAGVDAATIAKRLSVATASVPSYRCWTARQADTLAVLHAHFETITPRDGTHVALRPLAHQLRLSEADLLATLLTGALGPLRVDTDGTWCLAPTEAEKEHASIEYARAETARRCGWKLHDTVTTSELAASHERPTAAMQVAMTNEGNRRANDLAGRIFVDLSQMPENWRVTRDQVAAVSKRARARYTAAVRKAVIAAGYAESMSDDFVPLRALVQMLRKNTGRSSSNSVRYAIKRGSVAAVEYRGPSPSPPHPRPRVLVHCPRAVRESRDERVVLEWLGGEAVRRAATERQMAERRAANASRTHGRK